MNESTTRGLSNELLHIILGHIQPDPDPEKTGIDTRRFLSVESFDRPLDSRRDSLQDLGRFRCSCKRFAELGAPYLFSRVSARFSQDGLQRLERLTEWPHLASQVKVFTYLVPYFYKDGL
jgi:hypothetical protein